MTLEVYLHPFSSYCQKAKIAFYEKDLPFETRMLDGAEPVASDFAALWPIRRFPVMVDDGRLVFEATGIIEHLEARFPETPRLIPEDPVLAAEVRMWDRFFDNYIAYPQQRAIFATLGRDGEAAIEGAVERWRGPAETGLAVLEQRMAGREWAAGDSFSLADCAAAPALLYSDWTFSIPERFENVRAYRARLLARPSYARTLDEARPYRALFPLGAPEGRD